MSLIEKLTSLRKERGHLVQENSVPTPNMSGDAYGNDNGFINAKYARALRIQQIDREIDKRKREAFRVLYGGKYT